MEALGRPQIYAQMAVLAEDARSRILLILERQELTVGELCEVLQSPQSTVSRHLKTLSDGGWVASRRDGTKRLYHATLQDLDAGARRLWTLTREQVAATVGADQDARRVSGVLAERRKRSREFFADAAGRWDGLRDQLFGRGTHVSALLGLLDPDSVVADLGCGTGVVSEILAPVVRRVIAVDGSEAMLEAAKARLEPFGGAETHRGDLEALPLDDDLADLATLILVLHHLPDPGKAVEEVARILRPGGRLLVVDMLPHDRVEYQREMGHVWMGFSERQIRTLLSRSGLEPERFFAVPPDPAAKGPALFAATAVKGGSVRSRRAGGSRDPGKRRPNTIHESPREGNRSQPEERRSSEP